MKNPGMALRATFLALLVFFAAIVKAQTDTAFTKEWKLIDSLILQQNLTRTALTKLEALSVKARQRKLPAQAVKVLIYQYTLQEFITVNDQAQKIGAVRSVINQTTDPVEKAVLYSLLASQYASYYDSHRWKLMQRSTTTGYDKKDISTWSARDFDTAIINNYRRSITDRKRLQQVNIAAYDAVIIKGNMRRAKPTLFDLLANTALDRFMQPDLFRTNPINRFAINDPGALMPADDFLSIKFPVTDSTDRSWQALDIFRALLNFHRNDTDQYALIDADLRRLKWVYEQGVFPKKDSLYMAALARVAENFSKPAAHAGAWLAMANAEIQKAATYDAVGDTSNRYSYNAAEKITRRALQQSWPAEETKKLQELLADIKKQVLTTETEFVNIPGKPILAVAQHRNTDTIYGRIYQITSNRSFSAISGTMEPDWQMLKRMPFIRTFTQPLPATADHQLHHTSFKIDALPAGAYVLVTSISSDFPDTAKIPGATAMQQFHVSYISYIKNGADIFVLNRETGEPLSGVKVATLRASFNNPKQKKYSLDTLNIATTDQRGFFRSPAKYTDLRFVFFTANDTLNLNQYEYVYDQHQEEEIGADYEKKNSRVFFFTDRSIYRPGQTIYFKGIAVTKDRNTRLSKIIAKNETDWIYLRNVNSKVIDSLKVSINDYGSFAGSFRLPAAGLTGNYAITTKKYNQSQTSFSVEEYKRPLFTVSFDKPRGSYRLNDSVLVTGVAKAYSGKTIGNAKVVYNIARQARFPMPYYKRSSLPSIPDREIANGQIQTDENGRFSIRFKALADDVTDTTEESFYNFSVSADVTDISGETRSAATTIKAGFRSLILQLNNPPVIEKDSLQNINTYATNLSGEKQPTNIHIKIISLRSPGRPIRPRLLSRADQSTMSEAAFVRDFPNDEYHNEADPDNWPSDRIIAEENINAASGIEFPVKPGTLPAGYYKIEATAIDSFGRPVTQTTNIQLIDRNQLANPVYNLDYAVNITAEPGEAAVFLTGTSAEKLFVITSTTTPQQSNRYEIINRNKGMSVLRYTPKESDRGGIAITEAFVYNNRLYTNQHHIIVPWSNKILKVNFASYRNKTEPGSKETWTVSIEGNKADSTAAELLTTMYDISMDQFRPHNWQVPWIWNTTLSNYNFESNLNFTIAESIPVSIFEDPNTETFSPIYDRLAISALEFWNERPAGARPQVFNKSLGPAGAVDARPARIDYKTSETTVAQTADIISIRGTEPAPLKTSVYVVDGRVVAKADDINPKDILSITTLSENEAREQLHINAPGGAVVITTVWGNIVPVQIRKNLDETAFFFPQLHADSTGAFRFSFTTPEALTQWKWMVFAHTKTLSFGSNTTTITTQKKLMVQPNTPRFMREGDRMEFSSSIANLTDKEITGQATLELIDPVTNTPVDGWFNNIFPLQYFTIAAGQTTAVSFPLQIPFSYNKALTWRIIAKAEGMSDGEENTLAVLSNRTLVTETMPIFTPRDTTMDINFDKLLNNKSESLTHESITVEYTSNPVWYAVQALPYLIEFPYECSEQTFNRFYANTLASYIVNRHPRIKQVFEQWQKDSTSFASNLEKNEALKQLLLQETPWVLQAESEAQKKKNLALLFDLVKLSQQSDIYLSKLESMQLPDGSFSWFSGGRSDPYMTNYILTGIGKLRRLGALTSDLSIKLKPILTKAIAYMDNRIGDTYKNLVKAKADLSRQRANGDQLNYLFMRSFFKDIMLPSKQAYDYYYQQAKKDWVKLSGYQKAQLGLVYFRNNDIAFPVNDILPALLENAVADNQGSMFWKNAYTDFWYQSPIEYQSMMIAFVNELNQDKKDSKLTADINAMRTWLLRNKQTNNWKTTIATADACYALLLNGSDWLNNEKTVIIRLGNTSVSSSSEKTEAGTGYFKKRIEGSQVKNEMGNITLSVKSATGSTQSPSWGSIYWQYFEDLDRITAAAGGPLSIKKKLFIEKNTNKGKVLEPVNENDELKIGDKIIVRMELRSDRDMDYLQLKDMRAASMEPVNVLSGYKWQDGLGYYESTKDVSSNFFIDHLNKGTYIFEYPLFVTHTGVFSVGIATIQNMYAPEFSSHSEGMKIRVSK